MQGFWRSFLSATQGVRAQGLWTLVCWALCGIYVLQACGQVIWGIFCGFFRDFWWVAKGVGRILVAIVRALGNFFPSRDRGETLPCHSPESPKTLNAKEIGELVKLGCSPESAGKLRAVDMDYLQGLSEKEAREQLSMMDFPLLDKIAIVKRSQARSSEVVDWKQSLSLIHI